MEHLIAKLMACTEVQIEKVAIQKLIVLWMWLRDIST